ncbi:putative phosphohydrolase [Lachnospiraceae bacterium JC7]|nr:putative phosphohydrolase [Lachnospiraceae bacterium JC7]
MLSIAKIFIIILFLCCTMTICISEWERNKLKIFKYNIVSDKLKKEHRFVFLSDLHEKEFGKDNRELIEKIDELDPEFILIGGDLIKSHKIHKNRKYKDKDSVSVSVSLLEKLSKKYKIYFSYGNHEQRLFQKAGFDDCKDAVKYDKYIQDISKERAEELKSALTKVCVLDNSSVSFEDFDITGIILPMKYYAPLLFRKGEELQENELKELVGTPEKDKFHIMMIHTPMHYKKVIEHGADLVLSGHYHGGTIYIPYFGALMTPQFQFFVKECAGRLKYKDGDLIVNRGLGTHSVNIRINNRPEISLITIKPREEQYV